MNQPVCSGSFLVLSCPNAQLTRKGGNGVWDRENAGWAGVGKKAGRRGIRFGGRDMVGGLG